VGNRQRLEIAVLAGKLSARLEGTSPAAGRSPTSVSNMPLLA